MNMTKRRVVVALGGNAILSKDASAKAQQQALRNTAKYLVQFIENGDELIDQAFTNPTKPIGPFYSKEDAEAQHAEHPEFTFVEDAGRGYRRVVPSPKPVNVTEADVVNKLVNVGIVPISVGGGGVPVVREGDRLVGREAVIDKDFASEKLAEQIDADLLIILTAVDYVFVNFNQPDRSKSVG